MSLTRTEVPTTVKKLRVATSSIIPLASTSTIRGHEFTLDQPEPAGGGNRAPSPMEALLGTILGCTQVVTTRTATELGVQLGEQHAYVLAPQDSRGQAGVEGIQPYFTDATIYLAIETSHPSSDARKLRELAATVEKRCPGLNLIADAKVNVTVHWGFAVQASATAAEYLLHHALGLEPRVDPPTTAQTPHTSFTTNGSGTIK